MPISCRFYSQKYPEPDDVVMVNVRQIAEMGAYVRLLEYNDIEGMILLSELSRRRIRSINKLIRVGRNECVVVIRVDKDKGYIDLSKRRVSPEDITKCEEKFARGKAVNSILRHVAETLKYETDAQLEELYKKTAWYFDEKFKKTTAAYDVFKLAVTASGSSDLSVLDECDLDPNTREVLLTNIKHRLTPQAVKIRADIEVSCYEYEGIDAVKACPARRNGPVYGRYAHQVYVMTTTTMDRTEGLDALNAAIVKIEETIKKAGGVFTVQNPPKVVTETDELELAKQLDRLEQANAEIDGDDDDEEAEAGSGSEAGEDDNVVIAEA
ncbi:hypothetical protein HPB47_007688 [Ixodes persulcatus]|uniref:Uncharacterized protein n=1 Tax=Ixodes persulcatus TaxID=34615 RepID=A0AC60P6S5_IXOPE|nr:hypothetical protein HPB47_007688 [Ixodes persulcatus]